jgi:Tol biopolymer transport system component
MRRLLAGAVVWALALAPCAYAAEGAQLGFMRVSSKLDASVETLGATEGAPAPLWPGRGQAGPRPVLFSGVTWSGDGRYLIAAGAVGGHEPAGAGSVELYAVPADGGAPTAIPGTSGGLYPLGMPDGESVAFLRVRGHDSEESSGNHVIKRTRSRYSIWLAHLDGASPRQLTPWASGGSETPISASPDGTTLVVRRLIADRRKSRLPRSHRETDLLDLRTGKTTALGAGVTDAVFSPDGTRLAIVKEHTFLRLHVYKTRKGEILVGGESDIYVQDLATGSLTKVTSGPASDGEPSWDPSGQRLAFIRSGEVHSEAALFGIGDSIYEVNADGSCLTAVAHEAGGGFLSPEWRPGAEHAAGPISC